MAFSSGIRLENLNGRNGFIADVPSGNASAATSVDIVEDINGDGIDDLIVSAPSGRYGDDAVTGHVVFGRATGFEKSVDLSALDGLNGFAFRDFAGVTVGDRGPIFAKNTVSSAGDVNGDGINDVLISTAGAADAAGSVYVLYGRSTGFNALESLEDQSSEQALVIEGFGSGLRPVSGAGDVNGDGFDDVVIGSNVSSYVVFGGSSAGSAGRIDVASLDGSDGFVIERPGQAVSSAGDFNGDGIDDVIIGNPDANRDPGNLIGGRGESYVVLGRDTGFDASMTRADINAGKGFTIRGFDVTGNLGASVSNAGDINSDGIDDVIVGAPQSGYRFFDNVPRFGTLSSTDGVAYVVFGRTAEVGSIVEVAELDGSEGFAILAGGTGGYDVSSAGDFNNDGIDDVIVSASPARSILEDFPRTSVIFGQQIGFSADLRPNTDPNVSFSDSNSFTIGLPPSASGGDTSGGDLNGDGIGDAVVATESGIYVVFGMDDTNNAPIINDSFANIYVNADSVVVGDAFEAGEGYQGALSSLTDGSVNAADAIVGTPENDNIWAGTQGDDNISSGDGNDIIGIGDGNVRVSAGNGDDFVYAIGDGSGRNTIDLGAGNDSFYALDGENTIEGSGNNIIALGRGTNSVTTRGGDDFVYSLGEMGESASTTVLFLGEGNNTAWLQTSSHDVYTGSGDDIIGMGVGDDFVSSGGGNDIVYMANSAAGEGDKNVIAGDGNDYVQTGAGDDSLFGGRGVNTLFGGAGQDTFGINLNGYAFVGDFEAGVDQITVENSLGDDGLFFSQGSYAGDRTTNAFVYSTAGNIVAEVANTLISEVSSAII